MSRIDAIDEAIATTSAVRSIAAWGNSSDPDQLATYCRRHRLGRRILADRDHAR